MKLCRGFSATYNKLKNEIKNIMSPYLKKILNTYIYRKLGR